MQQFKAISYNLKTEVVIEISDNQKSRGFVIDSLHLNYKEIEVKVIDEKDSFIESYCNFIRISTTDYWALNPGDIILFKPSGFISLLYFKGLNDNALFLTNTCNNSCIICSQPPSFIDDRKYYLLLNSAIIDILKISPAAFGITGGEPTLLENDLIILIEKIVKKFPQTNIQILSNGRNFCNLTYTEAISKVKSEHMLICIPLHSDYYSDHDKITGIRGSFYETLKGIYNLFRFNINVEIRIVINKLNYKRLPKIASYIFKNLPGVCHIAFMGMEYTGLAIKNVKELLIFPEDYQNELEEAIIYLSSWGINVSIYNIPICLLNSSLYSYSVKSISNWKIRYFDECKDCHQKDNCGGNFNTSKYHSDKIRAIKI